MAIGSIINLGGGGGGSSSDAQVRLICNASTLLVGDTIKVRSLTDSSFVRYATKQSGDEFIFFDIPCKDYYKVCLVQEIEVDGVTTEVEIGGAEYYVSYGECVGVNVLDKTTVGGLQGLLNSHQENLVDVGDEVDVYVGGSPVKFQVADKNIYASHEIILVAKYLPTTTSAWSTGGDAYSSSILASTMATYYNSIDERDRQFIKPKTVYSSTNGNGGINSSNHYVWNPTAWEINGGGVNYVPSVESPYNTRFGIFTTQAGQIKKIGNETGSAGLYWTGSCSQTGGYSLIVGGTGGTANNQRSSSTYYLPAFHLLADS